MFDRVLAFCKVVSSSIGSQTPFTLYDATASDEETATSQEVYQSLGLIGRPRAPEKDAKGKESFLESLAARIGDGLAHFGFRDSRLHENFPAPKPGTIALVGYGGAFLSFDDTPGANGTKKATIATLYVPYEFGEAGVPEKAHVLTFDPSNPGAESIMLVHGAGLAISMDPTQGIIFRADATTFAQMKPGLVLVHAQKIMLKGNVGLGAQPEVGTPLTAGPVAPTRPSVFLSIV